MTLRHNRARFIIKMASLVAVAFAVAGGGCPFQVDLTTTLSPASGPTTGGTMVTITGRNFQPDVGVLFGDTASSNVTFVNTGLLMVETPAHGAGMVDVRLRQTDSYSYMLPAAFEFIEPPPPAGSPAIALASVTPDRGYTTGGTRVTILGANFERDTIVLFGSFLAEDIQLVGPQVLTAVAPAQGAGPVDVILRRPDGSVSSLANAFTYEEPPPLDTVAGGPKVVSAISTGNTSARITFSEPVAAEGAEDPTNYSIVQLNVNPEAGVLIVTAATLISGGTAVNLTTLPQNELVYQVTVTNVKDVVGHPIAPPDILVNFAQATFAGTPPIAGGIDTDEDGLSDNEEMRGWFVVIKMTNGETFTRDVTSDPANPDSDGDGLTDGEEIAIGIDPRSDDTDGDQVNDYEEWNEWFSDPTAQDSDGDTFSDSLDIFFRTSPVIADTDGDRFSDAEEIIERNRNPLVSDLPLPQITVDEVRLDLKITSSYTDEQGMTQTVEDTTTSTLTQSRSDKLSTSDTNSTESENEFSQKIGGEVSYSATDGFGGKVTAEAGFGQKRTQNFSTTVDEETARMSQNEYERSISNAIETSEKRTVERNIDEAAIQANVNIANRSDIAFTITNIEVSVLQQDRRNSRAFRPIATLRPTGAANPNEQPSYNLGPFDPERGPIIFQNVEVFPNLVDDLMREPTGLLFKVVNFDILDEFGRNFVFASQDVNDRTAGITIDFGDGTVESYRVATASPFGGDGLALGITMERALEIVGLLKADADDEPFIPPADPNEPIPTEIRKTYGTLISDDGFEILTRVRGVQNDLVAVPEAEKRFWAIVTSNVDLPRDVNFSEIPLRAGDDFLILFTRDIDKDQLFEREEHLYGSDDTSVDTDADTLGDFFEVRTGWTVERIPGLPYKVFSSPIRGDSDEDSLTDDVELLQGTDPNRRDTDEDGELDALELGADSDGDGQPEIYEIVLFDGDADDSNNQLLVITPYSDWAVIDGGNGMTETEPEGDDVAVFALSDAVAPGRVVITAGPNGVIDTTPAGDDIARLADKIVNGPHLMGTMALANSTASGDDVQIVTPGTAAAPGEILIEAGVNGVIDSMPEGDDYIRAKHRGLFNLDPLNQDTDFDGLPDGREVFIGTNPNAKDAGNVIDSDGDGLYDAEEDAGWDVVVQGSDANHDGMVDSTAMRHVTSNKFRADTDLDGLPDVFERAVRSDPRDLDTDDDGLFDHPEFDPDDQDGYYDDALLLGAFQRCAESPNCNFIPAEAMPTNRLRTSLVRKDSDLDGRDDNVEATVSWTVNVVDSGMPYPVMSKPWSADFDVDTLDDFEELAALTDPNLADTDGDGTDDATELTRGRNPLRKDKRVTVTLSSCNVTVLGDCEPDINGDGEFKGKVFLELPDDTQIEAYDLGTTCGGSENSTCCQGGGQSLTRTFILNENETFRVFSNQVFEDDGGCGPACGDEILGSFNEVFDFNLNGQTSADLMESSTCRLTFSWNVSAD